MKELYIAAHEKLVAKYLEAHPEASWDEAYKATVDAAYSRMQDKFADMVDAAKDRAKYQGLDR